jgi:thiol-disulfide isomerase/thioredoxin
LYGDSVTAEHLGTVTTMNNLRSKIELALNMVVVIAIVSVAVVTVKRHLSLGHPGRDHHTEHGQAMVGARMTIPGVGQEPDQKSLVLFLRKDCPACRMVAPLYRELIAEASKQGVRQVAILAGSLEEGKQYLRSLDLDPDHVQSADLFASYKISSVPTAVVLDGDGVIEGAWVGAAPGRENETRSEVIALLQAEGR